jgi:hypothetical protein
MPILRLTRRRLACVVLIVAALDSGGLWALFGEHGRVTRANFDRIRLTTFDQEDGLRLNDGMPLDEVLTILGPPDPRLSHDAEIGPAGYSGSLIWDTWDAFVIVTIFHGKADDKSFRSKPPVERLRHMWRRAFRREPPF